jgi:deoxyribose-phosphate aldolase
MDTIKTIAACIDQTNLKPDATVQHIEQLCNEASQWNFAAVCVSPVYVPPASRFLSATAVKICTVIGFPHGAHMTEVKVFEAVKAIEAGAQEIDMVIHIGALKDAHYQHVREDIAQVAETCHKHAAICKVIIETAYLSNEEKTMACRLAKEAQADFVKTSTGFAGDGATVADIQLMRKIVGFNDMGVKASGGIRSYADFKMMLEAGANRIGTSSGVKIIQEALDSGVTDG